MTIQAKELIESPLWEQLRNASALLAFEDWKAATDTDEMRIVATVLKNDTYLERALRIMADA